MISFKEREIWAVLTHRHSPDYCLTRRQCPGPIYRYKGRYRKEEEEGSLALYTHRVKWVHYIDEENDMVYAMRSWNSSSKLLVLLAITKRASKWSPICSYMDKKNDVNALLYLILSLCYTYATSPLYYILHHHKYSS